MQFSGKERSEATCVALYLEHRQVGNKDAYVGYKKRRGIGFSGDV